MKRFKGMVKFLHFEPSFGISSGYCRFLCVTLLIIGLAMGWAAHKRLSTCWTRHLSNCWLWGYMYIHMYMRLGGSALTLIVGRYALCTSLDTDDVIDCVHSSRHQYYVQSQQPKAKEPDHSPSPGRKCCMKESLAPQKADFQTNSFARNQRGLIALLAHHHYPSPHRTPTDRIAWECCKGFLSMRHWFFCFILSFVLIFEFLGCLCFGSFSTFTFVRT